MPCSLSITLMGNEPIVYDFQIACWPTIITRHSSIDTTETIIARGDDPFNRWRVSDDEARRAVPSEYLCQLFVGWQALRHRRRGGLFFSHGSTVDGVLNIFTQEFSLILGRFDCFLLDIAPIPKQAKRIFDSASTPEEIVDVMLMHTKTVKEHPEVAKAFVGAWYETMQIMNGGDAKAEALIADLADMSGGSVAEYKAQLDSTKMYYDPAEALDLMNSKRHQTTWDFVRTFSYDVGLFGEAATSPDFVGIEFPDGTVLGDKGNIQLRIDSSFTEMAVKGEL